MYTVKELIEALEKCNSNYRVLIIGDNFYGFEDIYSIVIDHKKNTVNLLFERS